METSPHTVRYLIQSEQTPSAGWKASRVGWGSFAEVFLAKEEVIGPGGVLGSPREIVAKIFKDEQRKIANDAFESEVEKLTKLTRHANIVDLRGVERRHPPTFVCAECGDVFHVYHCPDCEDERVELRNQGDAGDDKEPHVALICERGHQFLKSDMMDWRLQSARPCGHIGRCDVVNFLFTYCIYLEQLHVNLAEYLDMLRLTRPREETRGYAVCTVADRTTHPSQWTHETFLMRIGCLVDVAEALAYVHSCGILHGDLAPENIMVSFSHPLDRSMPQKQVPRLIDFGQARQLEELRHTFLTRARPMYVAPEVKVVNNVIGNAARLDVVGPHEVGTECFLTCQVFLAPGDYISDTADGGYEVLNEDTPESPSEQWPDILTPLSAGSQQEAADGPESSPFDSEEQDEDENEYIPASVCPRLERRYRLRTVKVPKGPRETLAFSVNHAVRVPADIYAFGSVIAWLLSDGSIELLNLLQSETNAASNRNPPGIDKLEPDVLDRVAEAMPLLWGMPRKSKRRRFFKQICREIASIVVRCLVRGKGAYAEGRSWSYDRAALRAAQDLRAVYERLYFWHRVRTDYTRFLQSNPTRVASLDNQIRDLKQHLEASRRDRDAAVKGAEEAESRLKEARAERERLVREADERSSQRAVLEVSLESYRQECEAAAKSAKQATKALEEAQAECERLRRAEEERRRDVIEPEHAQQLNELQGRLNDIQQRLEAATKEIGSARNAVLVERAEKERLAREVKLADPLKKQCAELAASNERLSATVEQLEERRRSAEEDRDSIKKLNQALVERAAAAEEQLASEALRVKHIRERSFILAKDALDRMETEVTVYAKAMGIMAPAEVAPNSSNGSSEETMPIDDRDFIEDGEIDADLSNVMSQIDNSIKMAAMRVQRLLAATVAMAWPPSLRQ